MMEEPLSLQTNLAGQASHETLLEWVDRIWQERGHMRNITEESLQAEIDAENGESSSSDEDDEDNVGKPVDVETRTKELFAARGEMLELISQASNEVMTLLDFVSLLVSKDAPNSAAQTMSPVLKSMTSAGTMSYDKTPVVEKSGPERTRARNEAVALNYQSLNSAADSLLGAATQLQTEMAKEARYWQEVLAVTEQGWNLSRLRGEGHTIGVRFGSSEAIPIFRARGIAALRPGEDGRLNLDRGSDAICQCLRVRVVEDGVVSHGSVVPQLVQQHAPLEALVKQARDSLFDQELFHELIGEARSLLSSSITVSSDCVHVPLKYWFAPSRRQLSLSTKTDCKLLVDLVDLEDQQYGSEDGTAEAVALYLRVGLSQIHRERYERRTRPPAPLTSERLKVGRCGLLESILCLLEHQHSVMELQARLARVAESLHTAGVPSELGVDGLFARRQGSAKANGKFPVRLGSKSVRSNTSFHKVFSTSRSPQQTTLSLSLPQGLSLSIQISTSVYAPNYGTAYTLQCSSPAPVPPIEIPESNDVGEIYAQAESTLRELLLRHMSNECDTWLLDTDGQSLSMEDGGIFRHMTVQLQNARLALMVRIADRTSKVPAEVLGVWIGDKSRVANDASKTHLMDIVRSETHTIAPQQSNGAHEP